MALTRHQRRHVLALKADADGMMISAERTRISSEAVRLLDGTADWPDSRLRPSEIHDWIEKPKTRGEVGTRRG